MKKLFIIPLLLLAFSFNEAKAFGSFKLIDFKLEKTGMVGVPFSEYINYIYSGDYYSKISVIGAKIPNGLTLGSINYGTNGVDSVKLSITPKESGVYPLTLILTDNNGAVLSQPFNFTVSDNSYSIITTALPSAMTGKQYDGVIKLKYFGLDNPVTVMLDGDGLSKLCLYPRTTVISTDYSSGFPEETIEVSFSGLPCSAGQYTVTLYVGEEKAKKYTLYIEKNPSIATGESEESATAGVDSTEVSLNVRERLIKTKDNPAVYLLENGARRLFVNFDTYYSWYGNDFSSVEEISQDEFDDLSLGKNVVVKSNSYIKFENGNSIYRIQDDVNICKTIETPNNFYLIQTAFEMDYTRTGDCLE